MKRRYLVLLGLVAFLVTLVLHAPAALLYAWAAPPAEAPVRLHGLHGTLARGGVAAVTVRGRPVLRELGWSVHPAWLVLLRFSADVEAGGETVLRGRIARSPFGALHVTDLSAAGSVKALLGIVGQPGLPLEGQFRLELPVLRIDDGVPVAAHGMADVANLAWTLAREPLPLGTFNAALSTDDKGILASIASGPGPLEVSGTATLNDQRAYDLHLQVRPRPEAAPALQSLVRSLGEPDAQGWHHVRRSGSF